MLKIHTLPLGAYQTNCYILHAENAKSCVIIDPGYASGMILEFLAEKGLTAEAILLTHGHFDHVGAVKKLVEKTGCALWMHEADWSQKPGPITATLFPLANCNFCEVQFFEDHQVIPAAGLQLQVIATPGHTWGSVCFLCEDALFSGDTLFAGSCGRTDLGGDQDTLHRSLMALAEWETDRRVFPGHGESTTLAWEKRYNPYMR